MAPPEDPESCRRLPEYTLDGFITKILVEYLIRISYIGVYSEIYQLQLHMRKSVSTYVRTNAHTNT